MAVLLSDETAIRMATHPKTNHVTRLILLAAERADETGKALFEEGELLELMNPEGLTLEFTARQPGRLMKTCVACDYIRQGSSYERLRLNPKRIAKATLDEVAA